MTNRPEIHQQTEMYDFRYRKERAKKKTCKYSNLVKNDSVVLTAVLIELGELKKALGVDI